MAPYPYRDEAGEVLFQVVRYRSQSVQATAGPRPAAVGLGRSRGCVWCRIGCPRAAGRSDPAGGGGRGGKGRRQPGRGRSAATSQRRRGREVDSGACRILAGPASHYLAGQRRCRADHAQQVAQSLNGIAESVRIVELPDQPPKGDVSDWLAAGGTRNDLKRLAEAAPHWTPAPSSPVTPPVAAEPAGMKYVPFPVDVLPEPIRSYVAAGAVTLGCEPAYIALPLLAVLASAVGNSRRVQLKQSWCEPCLVWAVIIGESGTLKSPAPDLALRRSAIGRRRRSAPTARRCRSTNAMKCFTRLTFKLGNGPAEGIASRRRPNPSRRCGSNSSPKILQSKHWQSCCPIAPGAACGPRRTGRLAEQFRRL